MTVMVAIAEIGQTLSGQSSISWGWRLIKIISSATGWLAARSSMKEKFVCTSWSADDPDSHCNTPTERYNPLIHQHRLPNKKTN